MNRKQKKNGQWNKKAVTVRPSETTRRRILRI
jgi:hypothetical protein